MAKFETKVCMYSQYGDVLFELERDEGGYFYKLPKEAGILWCEGPTI